MMLLVDTDRDWAADALRAGLQDVESLRGTVLDHMLLNRDDVVFTPYLAFNSREANERVFEATADNICRFLEGRPVHVVG